MRNSQIEEQLREIEKEISKTNNLVVFNDDYNSFQHVILTFMSVLGYDAVRSEQCAMIVHNNGKCKVKEGSFEELIPYRTAICDAGIDARIL